MTEIVLRTKGHRASRRLVAPKPRQHRATKTPVVFIHGLWLHASSWKPWVDYFNAAGYRASAPGWPDFPDTVAETRAHPEFMLDQTIQEVVDYYALLVHKMRTKPVVIGHSFGGLVAQELLDRELVIAAIAIDPAPIKGVLRVPFAQLKAAWPVLHRPANRHKAVILSSKEFRYGFANTLSDEEAMRLYRNWTIPAPGMPLWQAALANLTVKAQNVVDVRKKRAPLLLMAGQDDHTVPAETTYRVQHRYHMAPAITDLKEWPHRGHSLVIDNGWRELADYSLNWLRSRQIG